jgi:hypothetical protein
MDNFATGTQDGTGASIDIALGWMPDYVEVLNWEASDFCEVSWSVGMAAASAIKRLTSTFSKISSLGITVFGTGATDTFKGFRIGADTDLNVLGESITWRAYRNAEPRR